MRTAKRLTLDDTPLEEEPMETDVVTRTFEELFPTIAKTQREATKTCDAWGPLDDKTCQLIKLAFAVALGSENAVKAMVGRAKAMGIEGNQIRHSTLSSHLRMLPRSGIVVPFRMLLSPVS